MNSVCSVTELSFTENLIWQELRLVPKLAEQLRRGGNAGAEQQGQQLIHGNIDVALHTAHR